MRTHSNVNIQQFFCNNELQFIKFIKISFALSILDIQPWYTHVTRLPWGLGLAAWDNIPIFHCTNI